MFHLNGDPVTLFVYIFLDWEILDENFIANIFKQYLDNQLSIFFIFLNKENNITKVKL